MTGLTVRRLNIVRLIADGKTNREIAEALSLSEKTIEKEVSVILEELSVQNRAAAASWYVTQYGPVTAEDVPPDYDHKVLELDAYLHICVFNAQYAFQMRMGGQPQAAVHLARSLAGPIEDRAKTAPTPGYRKKLLDVLAELLRQQGWAYSEMSSANIIWTHQQRHLLAYLRALSKQYDYAEFLGIAEGFRADGHFVVNDYQKAIKYLNLALMHVQDERFRYYLFLTRAKAFAYRANLKSLNRNKVDLDTREMVSENLDECMKLIEEGSMFEQAYRCMAQGNAARAYALIGMFDNAFSSLEAAKTAGANLQDGIFSADFHRAQLVGEEFTVRRLIEPTANFTDLEERGRWAVQVHRKHPCERLAQVIENHLEESLNT